MDVTGIWNAVISHASEIGVFEQVNGHDTPNAPGHGLTAMITVEQLEVARGVSGLATTTGRLTFSIKIFSALDQEPRDDIDPNLVRAVDTLWAAYIGDFTLGGHVRQVDMFGQTGEPLVAKPAYIEVQGQKFRVMEITLPLICDDLWDQEA